jgi:hypothetical protein
MHLEQLTDMDKLEIVAAERMSYLGILQKRLNINQMLLSKIKNDQIRAQTAKLDSELRVEIKREQGKNNTEIVSESLDEFAKMDEMDGWLESMSEMMSRQDERASESKNQHL